VVVKLAGDDTYSVEIGRDQTVPRGHRVRGVGAAARDLLRPPR
jgi:hypothetical protein